ncbi:MAG: type III secretion system chaperone [Bacteroidota bacterium]
MPHTYLSSACLIVALLICLPSVYAQQPSPMTNARMDEILRKTASEVEGGLGGWQFIFQERPLFVITDEQANRMRIFTPVVEEQGLEKEDLTKLLQANFHSALDAKYCLYEGYVISVFTHPLGELTDEQFVDALRQVATLAENYGTTYSSTDLIFAPGTEEPKDEEEKRINKKPSKSR